MHCFDNNMLLSYHALHTEIMTRSEIGFERNKKLSSTSMNFMICIKIGLDNFASKSAIFLSFSGDAVTKLTLCRIYAISDMLQVTLL